MYKRQARKQGKATVGRVMMRRVVLFTTVAQARRTFLLAVDARPRTAKVTKTSFMKSLTRIPWMKSWNRLFKLVQTHVCATFRLMKTSMCRAMTEDPARKLWRAPNLVLG